MIIGTKKTIESIPLNSNLKETILHTNNVNILQNEGASLDLIYNIFKNRLQDHDVRKDFPYTCYIEQKALYAFLKFANDVYKERKHEAQGVFVGYYLHDEKSPQTEFVVCTHFIQASGKTTNVTCEMSTSDLSKYSEYCDRHHMLIIAHVHSHPGLSAFYSMPDSETLRTLFYASQNIGIVIDNLQNQYLAFKIYNGERKEEPIYVYDSEKCLSSGKLVATLISNVSHGSNFHTREVIDFSKLRSQTQNSSEVKNDGGCDSEKKNSSNGNQKQRNIRHIDIRNVEGSLEQSKVPFEAAMQNLPQNVITQLVSSGYVVSKEVFESLSISQDNKDNNELNNSFFDKLKKFHLYCLHVIPYVILLLLIGFVIVSLKSKTT